MIVSHDNFLKVNRVADHLFVFEGDGVVSDFQGSYNNYLAVRKKNNSRGHAESKQSYDNSEVTDETTGSVRTRRCATATDTPPAGAVSSKNKLTYSEQKEMQKLEKSIAKLTASIKAKEEDVASEESMKKGYSYQATLQEEADKMKVEVEEKELRWLELAEKGM